MILDNRCISLNGKTVFQRVKMNGSLEAFMSEELKACITYVVNGHEDISSSTGQVFCKSGDALVKQCRNYIVNLYPDEKNKIDLLVVHFHQEVLKSLLSDNLTSIMEMHDSELIPEVNAAKIKVNEHIHHFFEGLNLLFESDFLENEEFVKVKLKEILFLLFHSEQGEFIKSLIFSAFTPSTIRLKETVERYLYSGRSMKDIAFLCMVSESTFFRVFKREFGVSPKEYFRVKRLQRAAELLKFSDLGVSQISGLVGYNSLSRFSNSFKSEYALSPIEFRKVNNSKGEKNLHKSI